MVVKKLLIGVGILALFLAFALADDLNATNSTSENSTLNGLNATVPLNLTNATNSLPGELVVLGMNPSSFQIGDAQFAISVLNNKSEAVENIVALVSGKGYSTYSITTIDSLNSGQKGYILVSGNFKQSGKIELNVNLAGKDFKLNVSVDSQNPASNLSQADVQAKLDSVKSNYLLLQGQITNKQSEGYDVSKVSLEDAKKMIRDAESSLLTGKVIDAQAEVTLADGELQDQAGKLNGVGKVSLTSKLKDNAVIFSTIAGAMIAFFTLYELLKKKSVNVVNKVKEVKVNITESR